MLVLSTEYLKPKVLSSALESLVIGDKYTKIRIRFALKPLGKKYVGLIFQGSMCKTYKYFGVVSDKQECG